MSTKARIKNSNLYKKPTKFLKMKIKSFNMTLSSILHLITTPHHKIIDNNMISLNKSITMVTEKIKINKIQTNNFIITLFKAIIIKTKMKILIISETMLIFIQILIKIIIKIKQMEHQTNIIKAILKNNSCY